jgi:glycosyltransferase involved in cell wall biosynthesis
MKTVAVITSTTGRSTLSQTADSIAKQTYPCQHYVICDGVSRPQDLNPQIKVVELPNRTGVNGMMNGAICAMSAFIATEDYICWIDDDNWIEPNHIESLVEIINDDHYAYSLRNLMSVSGEFWMRDNCESIGFHGDMIDVNCFMIKRDFAVKLAPLWYNTTGTLMVGDRYVFNALRQNKILGKCTGLYTVNYRLSSNRDLRPFFFLNNIKMQSHFPQGFPWDKTPIKSNT